MEAAAARQRLNAQPIDGGTLTNEKTPSGLERGHSNEDQDEERKPNGAGEMKDPPLTKSKRFDEFKRRARGKHLEHIPTLKESLMATVTASWINIGLVFVVASWVAHYRKVDETIIFVLSFLALIPLEKLLQFGSHQSMLYLGHSVGDLVNVTLMNAIEAILAILLLRRECSLKILQSVIVGVILLQLLLVPGVMFLAGGTRLKHQELHASQTQLNQSMMTMGVMCLVLPAAFFAGSTQIGERSTTEVVTDGFRHDVLMISRGMAIIMLCVYIGSRIYQVNPPGDDDEVYAAAGGHEAFHHAEEALKKEPPKLSPWFCFAFLIVLVVLIAFTAEWLVDSIEHVLEGSRIKEEWFGLILLPLISFSGDGVITFSYAFRKAFLHHGKEAHPLADAKPIDLSIQFALFWTPVLVLLAWIIGKPLPLLFDIFEVVLLVAAVFVVNYITADSKTNWAEGWTMICFFFIIALVAWFYPGQDFFTPFFQCTEGGHAAEVAAGATETVTSALAAATTTAAEHGLL